MLNTCPLYEFIIMPVRAGLCIVHLGVTEELFVAYIAPRAK